MARKKKPKIPLPRIPMPTKPPKVEPDPKIYTRKPKHKQDWEDRESDAATSDEDK
jgi:hypothetical protein